MRGPSGVDSEVAMLPEMSSSRARSTGPPPANQPKRGRERAKAAKASNSTRQASRIMSRRRLAERVSRILCSKKSIAAQWTTTGLCLWIRCNAMGMAAVSTPNSIQGARKPIINLLPLPCAWLAWRQAGSRGHYRVLGRPAKVRSRRAFPADRHEPAQAIVPPAWCNAGESGGGGC